MSRWLLVSLLVPALAGCGAARPRPTDGASWRGAIEEYTRLCEQGFTDGCVELSDHLRKGTGIAMDLPRAYALAARACSEGSARACHLEGISLFRAQGVAKDLAASTARYERGCAGGVGEACRDLGNALAEGRGVPVDLPRARALWRQECPRTELACVMLGRSHEKGEPALALDFFKEGCRAGGGEDCHEVAYLIERKDPQRSLRYLRTACAREDACGCIALAQVAFEQARADEGLRVAKESCALGRQKACALVAIHRPDLDEPARERELGPLCTARVRDACGWFCAHPAAEDAAARCKTACELGLGGPSCPAR